MRNYEVTFIVEPTLSGDEVKATAQKYVDQLQANQCQIVHVDEMGLRRLAYDINNRHSGHYYCIEFRNETGAILDTLELDLHRDERILRFLTVKLDKFGVKYNEDKRLGKIGKATRKPKAEPVEDPLRSKSRKPTRPLDNLKRIEGIGPKIADVLRAAGVDSYAVLATKTADDIKDILGGAGERFSFQDPVTWPEQARMAADGEWDKLRKWQDKLKAGKEAEVQSGEQE